MTILWDEPVAQFPTTEKMMNRLRDVKEYGHILGHQGLDRLAVDLGIKDATDNISGYSTYKYYRDRGYTHRSVMSTGILSYGRNPWGFEEYRAAEQRYKDERL